MNIKALVLLLLLTIAGLAACEKNTVSKVPQISGIAAGPDSIHANTDTTFIEFSFVDGDADIGNDPASAIYVKDSRYDTGFLRYDFPQIADGVEDPKKGLTGKCIFLPYIPSPIPRTDSPWNKLGDTLVYEYYITDRAHHQSNHLTTQRLYIFP
jgi:hypothetical protein